MRGRWTLAAGGTAGVALAAAAALTGRVLRAERIAEVVPGAPDGTQPRPVLVVFGAGTTPAGPSRELRARLDHAVMMWRRRDARAIVVSGGAVGELDEVADMRAYLVAMGVPDRVVVDGRPGANTRQTVATMARLTRDHGMGPWLAVSSPYHARRIRDEALRQGLDVTVSGPAHSPEMLNRPLHRSRIVSEVLATVWYALPATVTQRVRTGSGTWRHTLPHRLAGQWEAPATDEDPGGPVGPGARPA